MPPQISEQETGLIGLNSVVELVRTIIWTGQVKGERPASAIICAPIGSGKTSVFEKMKTEVAEYMSDFTARDGKRILENKNLSHIMIGDFLSVLGHKEGTVKHAINILSKLSGEGTTIDPFDGRVLQEQRKIGIITAIPPQELRSRKLKPYLFGGGFASRFLIVRYDYDRKTVEAIHDYIKSDGYTREKAFGFSVENAKLEIKIPQHIAEKIQLLSKLIQHDPIGVRAHRHLRSLVKARARMNGRATAEERDFKVVERFSDFFKSEGKTL